MSGSTGIVIPDFNSGQPNKKRKPQGTLVNPNLKKRKVAGAKFGGGSENNE